MAARPCSPSSTPFTSTPRALPSTRRRASFVTALSWLKNSAASIQGNDQRQRLLPTRFHGVGGLDKGLKTLQGRTRNWAYFSFGHKYPLEAEVSKSPTFACNKCHQDSAKQDWVFTQNYNVLPAAAPRRSEGKPGASQARAPLRKNHPAYHRRCTPCSLTFPVGRSSAACS